MRHPLLAGRWTASHRFWTMSSIQARLEHIRVHNAAVPYRALAVAILQRAMLDWLKQKKCPAVDYSKGNGGRCCPEVGWHVCSAGAADYLRNEEAGELYDLLDINRGFVLEQLGIEEGNTE